jgi:tRNA(Ile)-lysidine synthase
MVRQRRAVTAPDPTPDDFHRATDSVDRAARAFVRASHESREPIALAVSGGCDSMVLMHAVALELERAGATRGGDSPRVLTFDHGTGRAASEAAELVACEATRLGFDVRVGRASLPTANEAEWRAARWRFFLEAAPGARIATAHTRDDQLETVVMRTLRGTGARGLAGLAAGSRRVVRPFLQLARTSVRAYGNSRGIPFVEDPSNASGEFLRNRVRLDLLPAIHRVRPRFAAEMLALAERAAAWRAEVDALAATFVSEHRDDGTIRVAREELATYDSATLCVLWPAIAARASVTLDRRGTLRLAQFTTSGAPGARMQLSGGVEVFRHRGSFVFRRSSPSERSDTVGAVALSGAVQFGGWRFQPVVGEQGGGARPSRETPDEGLHVQPEDPWVADLPADRSLMIRAWRPADRMRSREGGAARRVKRFFSDARIAGPSRAGWPVVLADDEIVWIPGVRRSHTASERSGRPVVRYFCERSFGGLSSG